MRGEAMDFPGRYGPHRSVFSSRQLGTPCLLLDLNIVTDKYERLASALPEAEIYCAVKANGDPGLLTHLARLGAGFDVASPGEISLCLGSGVARDRLSFGHTVKKGRDIASAWTEGVPLVAVDSIEELEELETSAPGAGLVARLSVGCEGARWPISRKFGLPADDTVRLLRSAAQKGFGPLGVTFHVGSQQEAPQRWSEALGLVAQIRKELADCAALEILDLGGGLPAAYSRDVAPVEEYGKAIRRYLSDHKFQDCVLS